MSVPRTAAVSRQTLAGTPGRLPEETTAVKQKHTSILSVSQIYTSSLNYMYCIFKFQKKIPVNK